MDNTQNISNHIVSCNKNDLKLDKLEESESLDNFHDHHGHYTGRNDVKRDKDFPKHNEEEESIEAIMAKAKSFELEDSFLDDNYEEESIEALMKKAKSFALDESFPDKEIET